MTGFNPLAGAAWSTVLEDPGLNPPANLGALAPLKDVVAAAGSVAITGTAALAQGKNIVAAAGNVAGSSTGTAALAQGANVVAAASAVAITGAAAVAQKLNVIVATSTVAVAGTAALVQGLQVIAATGTSLSLSTGTAALAQLKNVIAAAGAAAIAGTSAIAQKANVTAGTGAVAITGTSALLQGKNFTGVTYTATITHNSAGTFDGVQDTFLWSSFPTQNSGSSLQLGTQNTSTGDNRVTLIRFTGLSNLPADANIISAQIDLFNNIGTTDDQNFFMTRLVRSWTESGATWNKFDGVTNWTTAGAGDGVSDYDGSITLASLFLPTGTTGYVSFIDPNLAPQVQRWVSGAQANNGVYIQRNDGLAGTDTTTNQFLSTQHVDGVRPRLTIVYTTNTVFGGASLAPLKDVIAGVGTAVFASTGTAALAQAKNVIAGSAQLGITGTAGLAQKSWVVASAGAVGITGTAPLQSNKNVINAAGGQLILGIVVAHPQKDVIGAAGTVFSGGVYTPGAPERVLGIIPENRAYIAPAGLTSIPTTAADRVYVINAENRVDLSILAENRVLVPNAENRVFAATPENRVDPI